MPSSEYSRPRPGRKTSLSDVLVIQRTIFYATQNPSVKPSDLAALAKAWDTLENRKRILRGLPPLAAVKVERKKRKDWKGEPTHAPREESSAANAIIRSKEEGISSTEPTVDAEPGGGAEPQRQD